MVNNSRNFYLPLTFKGQRAIEKTKFNSNANGCSFIEIDSTYYAADPILYTLAMSCQLVDLCPYSCLGLLCYWAPLLCFSFIAKWTSECTYGQKVSKKNDIQRFSCELAFVHLSPIQNEPTSWSKLKKRGFDRTHHGQKHILSPLTKW